MATFRIKVVVDPTSAVKGTRVVERSLTRVQNRADRLRRTLGLTFAALAGGAIIFGAIRNMARFEESIAVVRAVTKATALDFENLRDRAQQLGISTRFSATQAADAMVLLARAGFSVSETMEAVGQTLLLAQAGGLQMAEAADITASALRGFGLATSETARVTDVLVETANSANTNVSQLGQALKFVAPIARGLGQSIEITNAALGALSDAGLKGTLAGTGLRRVLAELASPGRELADILDAAGLVAADVDPKVVGLTAALEQLKLSSFDTGDALEVFGQRGGPAFAVLVENIPKIRALEQALKKSGGEAARVAGIMDMTLNGALFRMKSALEGLNLAIGEVFASPLLIEFLNVVTEGLRLAARNADLLQIALIALTAAAIVKLATVLASLLAPAILKTILALIAFKFNVLALAASFITLSAAMTVAPFIAVTAAVIPLAFAIQRYNANMKELGEILERTEEDSKFVRKEFSSLMQVTRELSRQQRINAAEVKKSGKASEAQVARVAKLTAAKEAQEKITKQVSAAQKEENARAARGAVVTEAAIKRLERRRDVLAALTKQAKDLVAFQAELDRLEQAGATPTSGEKERIRRLIEQNVALANQKRIFDEIKGPQRAFVENTDALRVLLKKGAISAGEFAIKMQELQDSLAQPIDVQLTSLEQLEKSNKLMARRLEVGDQVADMEELLEQLGLKAIPQNQKIMEQIAAAILLRDKLRDTIKKTTDAEREAQRAKDAEVRQLDRLERRIKSQEALNKEVARIKVLFDANRLSLLEFNRAMEDVQLKSLEASLTLEDGFTRAFIKIKREAEDLAAVGESVVNVFADNATDALVKFAETGQFAFKEFANAILQDLIRIIARLLIVQALSALTGVPAPAIGAAAGAATPRKHGGTVQPGRSFIVGDGAGPELFTPDRTGTITPNPKDQPQQAPAPIIQVINVKDEDEVPNAINSGKANDAIINMLASEKDRVNQVLS